MTGNSTLGANERSIAESPYNTVSPQGSNPTMHEARIQNRKNTIKPTSAENGDSKEAETSSYQSLDFQREQRRQTEPSGVTTAKTTETEDVAKVLHFVPIT